jgi:MFS family permease
MRLSIWEGTAWAVMVGLGETYFIADAVRLHASALQLALTITLPLALAGAGPLTVLGFLGQRVRRKSLVISAVLAQALVLVSLSVTEHLGASTPSRLIALVCLYQIMGQGAGTAWSSWISDLVPHEVRGRYFGRRNRGVYIGTCVGLVTTGILLHWLEPVAPGQGLGVVGGTGFELAFLLAAAFRVVSGTLLCLSSEPEFTGLAHREQALRFLKSDRGTRAFWLLGLVALFHFAVYTSAPYYGAFMLETLRFSYLEYMSVTVALIVIKSLVTPWWGGVIDRYSARGVWILALFAIAVVPVPWIFAHGLLVILLAQLCSGVSWSAFELSYFTLLLESSTRRTRPSLFAAQSLLVGWAQLGAGVLAAWMLPLLGNGYRGLFLVSAVARLLAAITAGAFMPRASGLRVPSIRGQALRFLGIRAHGGLARRPVFESSPPEEDGAP